MKHLPDPATLARIDALPDEALARALPIRSDLCYAVVAIGGHTRYVSDPDFSTCKKTRAEVIAACAAKIRDDLRGIGKYAPHWDAYCVRYRLLPYWEGRASALGELR